eukprot:1585150-Pyramimonas_sp.AAC.1
MAAMETSSPSSGSQKVVTTPARRQPLRCVCVKPTSQTTIKVCVKTISQTLSQVCVCEDNLLGVRRRQPFRCVRRQQPSPVCAKTTF